jgi:hypothetical protein
MARCSCPLLLFERKDLIASVYSGRSPVTVPLHITLDRGTLRAILRTVETTPEDFLVIAK